MIEIQYNNNLRGKVICDTQDQFEWLYDKLSIDIIKYTKNGKEHVTVSSLSPIGTFLSGLAFDIKRILPEIKIDNKFLEYNFPYLNFNKEFNIIEPNNIKYKYRYYQKEAIISAYKMGRGIIESPTASGKSIIMYGIIENLPQFKEGKTLILVPNNNLVTQLCDDFKKYGHTSYSPFYKDSNYIQDTQVIITSRTWLNNHINKLPKISHLICDEIQKLSRNSSYETCVKHINTKSIFGLTATMPAELEQKWYIKGMIGPTIFKESAEKLQQENYLSKINIISIKINHTYKPDYLLERTDENISKWYYDEYHYLEDHLESNMIISELIQSLEGNTMILFDHTILGENLFDLIKGNKRYIDGSIKDIIRDEIKNELENNNDIKLIAQSTCFGTGISINNIKNIIIPCHSKRLTKILQQVGRGLRKTKSTSEDEYMNLFDIYFNFRYSEKHAIERMTLYNDTYGKKFDKQKSIYI